MMLTWVGASLPPWMIVLMVVAVMIVLMVVAVMIVMLVVVVEVEGDRWWEEVMVVCILILWS